jgi:hypothetical protein
VLTHKEALQMVLQRIDYNAGHCGSMEAISNLVPHWVLRLANESLEEPASDVEQDALCDDDDPADIA